MASFVYNPDRIAISADDLAAVYAHGSQRAAYHSIPYGQQQELPFMTAGVHCHDGHSIAGEERNERDSDVEGPSRCEEPWRERSDAKADAYDGVVCQSVREEADAAIREVVTLYLLDDVLGIGTGGCRV